VEAVPPMPEPLAAAGPPREIVPAAHLEYIEILLELAGDAFAPINEAEFAGPDFGIQTPPITTAPLRAKVVFGPSPSPPPDHPARIARDHQGAAADDGSLTAESRVYAAASAGAAAAR
jgi:hypothetical protein